MSQPRPLTTRMLRLAAGMAIALPAISLYGATGAWADKPVGAGSGASHAAAESPAAGAPGNSDHAKQAGDGNAKKADSPAPVVAVVSSSSVAAAAAAPVAAAKPGSSDHSKGTAATVGSPSAPQPLSNADKNKGGANNAGNCGDYCSTRDGSPSMNGNGGGGAGGRPCAGCVGKADNKNPPGQYKNGSDHNNGYECDGNNGIGKGNPAHTGCTPPPPCTVTHTCPPPPCTVTHTCPPPCTVTHTCPPPPPVDCLGHLKSLGHSDAECPKPPCVTPGGCGGTTTGGTTGTTTTGTTGTTTGGTTGTTTGGTTGTSGGFTTGAAGGAQGTTGKTTQPVKCPSLTGGSGGAAAGPMPKGCAVNGSGGGGALPFTGLDVGLLIGTAAIALGVGLGLTAVGSHRRREDPTA